MKPAHDVSILKTRYSVRTFRKERERVGGIAGDAALNWFDPFPISLRCPYLQASDVLREQHSQRTYSSCQLVLTR
jgi:hypothetical protein